MWNRILKGELSLVTFLLNHCVWKKKLCEVFYENWIWMILNMKSGYHPLWIILTSFLCFSWPQFCQSDGACPLFSHRDRAALLWKCTACVKSGLFAVAASFFIVDINTQYQNCSHKSSYLLSSIWSYKLEEKSCITTNLWCITVFFNKS